MTHSPCEPSAIGLIGIAGIATISVMMIAIADKRVKMPRQDLGNVPEVHKETRNTNGLNQAFLVFDAMKDLVPAMKKDRHSQRDANYQKTDIGVCPETSFCCHYYFPTCLAVFSPSAILSCLAGVVWSDTRQKGLEHAL
jgi:hypothetical protein